MRLKYFALTLISLFLSTYVFCREPFDPKLTKTEPGDTIEKQIDYLKKYFSGDGGWIITDPEYAKNAEGLIHFIEAQPIDTILKYLKFENNLTHTKVLRLPDFVSDTLKIPGYISYPNMMKTVSDMERATFTDVQQKDSELQTSLLRNIEKTVSLIPSGEGSILFDRLYYTLPDSLKVPETIPESMLNSSDDFQRILKLDSLRLVYVEGKRVQYNDSVISAYLDSVISLSGRDHAGEFIQEKTANYIDSVLQNNANLVQEYNGCVVSAVNDTISAIIFELSEFANRIDSTTVYIQNPDNSAESMIVGGYQPSYMRVWLKNRQNDSLSVLIENTGKRNLKMLIDDHASINRFSQQKIKDFSFGGIEPSQRLVNIKNRFKVETPWSIGGDGNVGFTQTYLSNWSKGGKSAVSMLLVLKGFANYSTLDGKIKWENSGEIRNGWLRTGSDADEKKHESQKNDDKFEIISRFGVSAFKEWYYSAEVDFETQFFYGYKYPVSQNPDPISGFLAPAKTLFKIGLDYKPNKNLSVFLSPITSKSVFIRDTAKINKDNFNIPDGKRRYWVPGLNADVSFKTTLMQNITWETKYKMFVNYTAPFKKFDINWENLVVMKVNNHIDVRMMLHLIYDDDVLFTVNENGVDVKKPKLQIKELVTVGFSYKINKKVFRAKQIS